MIIDNPLVLEEFRGLKDCEYCHRRRRCDAAHVFACGLGNRIDDPLVVLSLCRECHTLSHNANSANGVRPNHEDLVMIVASRNSTTPEAILEWVQLVRRTPKEQPVPDAPGMPVKHEPKLYPPPF